MNPQLSTPRLDDPGSARSVAPLRLCMRAFTFVEILAALFFLAILIPVIVEGVTLSSRISVLTERGTIATELAQNKMCELTLGDTWVSADAAGDFGEDRQGYRWEVTQSTWDMDAMTLLAVKVYFTVQGVERSVTLSTLVNPATAGTTATSTSSSATSATSQTK